MNQENLIPYSRNCLYMLDWRAFNPEQLSLEKTDLSTSECTTITKSIAQWILFFNDENPQVSVDPERLRYNKVFRTPSDTYSIPIINPKRAVEDLFESFIEALLYRKKRGLKGEIYWMFLGSNTFFLVCEKEILLEEVVVSDPKYFKIETERYIEGFLRGYLRLMYQKFFTETWTGQMWLVGMDRPFMSFDVEQDSLNCLGQISHRLEAIKKLLCLVSAILILILCLIVFK